MKKYILGLLALLGLLGTQSCENESYDIVGNPNNLVYFVPSTSITPQNFFSFEVAWTSVGAIGQDVIVKLPVKSTRRAEGVMKVHAEIDNSLVNLYNSTHGASYNAFPDDAYNMVKSIVTIENDQNMSEDSIEVTVPLENFTSLDKREYLLPIRLTDVDGKGKVSIQENYNVIWAAVKVEYPGDVKYDVSITNGVSMGTYTFNTSTFPSAYTFTASSASTVRQEETVTFVADRSLVEYYNKNVLDGYVALPENADITIEGLNATIALGEKKSSEVKVTLNSMDNLVEGTKYMLPITIKEVSNGLQVKESYNTIYLIIDYPDPNNRPFTALDISNYECYSNYYFANNLQKSLSRFTYEIKIKANEFNGMSRFFAFNGSNSVMYRFGEGGNPTRLQYATGAGGNHFANATFAVDTWYLLTLTYDGSNLTFYVNGVKDSEHAVSNYSILFQGIEIGMSWAGYPSQQVFNGSICEARVWERALSAAEIGKGLCGVEPESAGLVAYWKMNEGSGSIFYDLTGNGYNVDWSDTYRCLTESENSPGTHLTDRHNYIKWDNQSINLCQ